jgi:hypothetical protein
MIGAYINKRSLNQRRREREREREREKEREREHPAAYLIP